MNYAEESVRVHRQIQGKISTKLDYEIDSKDALSIAYTPGIAEVSRVVHKDKNEKYALTSIGKTIAVISNGTAVLGLGNIGAEAAYPVMEGKAALFKRFGDVNAVPICVDITDVDELVNYATKLSINFAGINLEDIKAPECFAIEKKLQDNVDIPIFHDDQHGTAIVVYAGLKNALKLAKKDFKDIKIVFLGAGAAGIAVAKFLLRQNPKELLMLDSKGILTKDREYRPEETEKMKIAELNTNNVEGGLTEAIKDADVFIGVSKPGLLTKEHIKSMKDDPIIFAMSNPTPEIMPGEAKEAGVLVMATGRSDFPNQINNVLAFPGILAGAIKAKAKRITHDMKVAAAEAIANCIDEPSPEKVIPSPLDAKVHKAVEDAVANATK